MFENSNPTFSGRLFSDASTASYNRLTTTAVDIVVASTKSLSDAKLRELRKLWTHAVQIDTNAIGWLPKSVFDSRASTDEVTAVYRAGDLVGWALRGTSTSRRVLKIYQIWVRPDARIVEHGTALIGQLRTQALMNKCSYVEAWVAEDLPANLFWEAIGFQRTVWRWGRGQSLRKIWRWITTPATWGRENCQTSQTVQHGISTNPEWAAVENYDTAKRRHTFNGGALQAMAKIGGSTT